MKGKFNTLVAGNIKDIPNLITLFFQFFEKIDLS